MPNQSQKRGLKHVVGVTSGAPPAHVSDHRAVPPDEELKGTGVTIRNKPSQQLDVGRLYRRVAGSHSAEVVYHVLKCARHSGPPFHRLFYGD